jgi:hypothetical protein
MASLPAYNNNEGGTNTTTISTANSGGASGTAWSLVTIGASTTITFSNTQKRGTLAMAILQPATYANTHVDWTGLAIAGGVDVYCRFYMWIPALPTVTSTILRVKTQAAADCGYLQLTTSGFLRTLNAAAATVATGAVAVPTSQWFRIETRIRASATVGQLEWRLFKTADSTTADEAPAASTSVVLGADIGELWWGDVSSPGHVSTTWFWDDIAASTAGWIGPSVAKAPSRNVVTAQAMQRAATR